MRIEGTLKTKDQNGYWSDFRASSGGGVGVRLLGQDAMDEPRLHGAVEALWLCALLPIGLKTAVLTSLIANAASFGVGALLWWLR